MACDRLAFPSLPQLSILWQSTPATLPAVLEAAE
jgi:hypothetical protein